VGAFPACEAILDFQVLLTPFQHYPLSPQLGHAVVLLSCLGAPISLLAITSASLPAGSFSDGFLAAERSIRSFLLFGFFP